MDTILSLLEDDRRGRPTPGAAGGSFSFRPEAPEFVPAFGPAVNQNLYVDELFLRGAQSGTFCARPRARALAPSQRPQGNAARLQ